MVIAGGVIASQGVKESGSANPEMKIEFARFLGKMVSVCSVFTL